MNTKTAAAALALGLSLSLVPVAAFAATPAQEGAPVSVTNTQAAATNLTLQADQTNVAPFQRVNFTATSPVTGSAVLYQNGKPAPNVRPIPVTANGVSKFYYQPGMTGTYFLRVGTYQSNSVTVTVR